MKTKYKVKGFVAVMLLALAVSSCESYNEAVIDSLDVNRTFSPVGISAVVRNKTTVELNWMVKEDADHYIVEISADDPNFSTIYKTLNVAPTELPVQIALEGETVYSFRVKAISATGLEDSKWSLATATTLAPELFLPIQDGDIEAKQATLRWTPNNSVAQIVLNPGALTHTLTATEKTEGIAIITGLSPETAYTAELVNGTKKSGKTIFTTGIDIGTGILVKAEDDLNAKINEAPSGSILVLMPGDYTVFTGEILLNKSITLRGLRSYDKPKLHVKFTLNAGTSNLSLIDLDLEGTAVGDSNFITLSGASTSYGDILISGCNVHDYLRALVYGNASAAKLNSFTVDNSIVKNVNTNAQADFIDFRNTYVANVVVKNSTFDTCSVGRDFVRADAVAPANGFSGTGLTTNVLIESCTLYKVSNTSASKRLLYLRFASNASTVRNTLITSTSAIYTNQPATTMPTFNKNYYNEAISFVDGTIVNNKIDASATSANPQFVDPANGDFTVKNQTIIDNNIGDPRWLK
ncbi:DUF5123 domain-containing protein [Flavobacterium sp. UW10123]|uniref:DUF5123 domain-containing protein n=1 Tax=Flavobacterium sp. UW10123 TaxID=3230800 RepID=UPI003393D42B